MANLNDYLMWRGDLKFKDFPFNSLDNLVFSMISYIKLSKIAPEEPERSVSLEQVANDYILLHGEDDKIGQLIPTETVKCFLLASKSPRFKDVRICHYLDKTDEGDEKQFAAMTFLLPDDVGMCIAFRGTDDTLVGWKEDMNMSFLRCIPSQAASVYYLEQAVDAHFANNIYITGHSKGGNLAMYSASFCRQDVFDKITTVYSNDGPGFAYDVAASPWVMRIFPKLVRLVPQTSVVGFLLDNGATYKVVRSTASGGIAQHNGFTWQVMKDDFEYLPEVTKDCLVMRDTIRTWLKDKTPETMRQITESVYGFLSSSEAKTLTDLNANRAKLMTSLRYLDSETRKSLLGIIRCLLGAEKKRVLNELDKV